MPECVCQKHATHPFCNTHLNQALKQPKQTIYSRNNPQRLTVSPQLLSLAQTPVTLSMPLPDRPQCTRVTCGMNRSTLSHAQPSEWAAGHWGRRRCMCVPSNTPVSVKDCQVVSNSPHPCLNYGAIDLSLPLSASLSLTLSVSWSVWPLKMWISAEALTTQTPACQQVRCRRNDALHQKCVWRFRTSNSDSAGYPDLSGLHFPCGGKWSLWHLWTTRILDTRILETS